MLDYETMTSDEILDTIFEENGTDEILGNLFDGEHNKEAVLVYLHFLKLLFLELQSEEQPEYVEKTMVILTKIIGKFVRRKSFTDNQVKEYLIGYLTALSACADDCPSVFAKIQPYLKSIFIDTPIL